MPVCEYRGFDETQLKPLPRCLRKYTAYTSTVSRCKMMCVVIPTVHTLWRGGCILKESNNSRDYHQLHYISVIGQQDKQSLFRRSERIR